MVSIGLASMHRSDTSADRVLIRADHALYKAKAAGRNRIELYADGDAPHELPHAETQAATAADTLEAQLPDHRD